MVMDTTKALSTGTFTLFMYNCGFYIRFLLSISDDSLRIILRIGGLIHKINILGNSKGANNPWRSLVL